MGSPATQRFASVEISNSRVCYEVIVIFFHIQARSYTDKLEPYKRDAVDRWRQTPVDGARRLLHVYTHLGSQLLVPPLRL